MTSRKKSRDGEAFVQIWIEGCAYIEGVTEFKGTSLDFYYRCYSSTRCFHTCCLSIRYHVIDTFRFVHYLVVVRVSFRIALVFLEPIFSFQIVNITYHIASCQMGFAS